MDYAQSEREMAAQREAALKKARELNAEGKRVEAVKTYRIATGTSLWEAQAAIDGKQ